MARSYENLAARVARWGRICAQDSRLLQLQLHMLHGKYSS